MSYPVVGIQRLLSVAARLLLVFSTLFVLASCGDDDKHHGSIPSVDDGGDGGGGGGGGGDGGGGDGGGGGSTPREITGGGVKGPLTFATVTLYVLDPAAADGKGAVVDTGTTNAQAQIEGLEIAGTLAPPYLLEFTSTDETRDLTTGEAPILGTMRTILRTEDLSSGNPVYASPLVTMALDIALANADSDAGAFAAANRDLDANDDGTDDIAINLGNDTTTLSELLTALPIAASQVKSTVGFGLGEDVDLFNTPPLLNGTTEDADSQANAVAMRSAIEALAAVVRQISEGVGAESNDAVFDALTADLGDGEIDGQADGQEVGIFEDEEQGNAALELFEQEPGALCVVDTDSDGDCTSEGDRALGDKSVADMAQEVVDETSETGSDVDTGTINVETLQQTTADNLKPAELNPDIDGDGVLNDQDAFPTDNTESVDTDRDGKGNNSDTDDDNDGVVDGDDDFALNSQESLDTDNDGTGNNADTDDDGDNVSDLNDDFPLDASKSDITDVDGDGWPAGQDPNDNNGSIPAGEFVDTDTDGVGDNTDTDDDNDGVADGDDSFPNNPSEQKDLDHDGIGDNQDTDKDGDSVADSSDVFPRDGSETTDTDRDGIGNNADTDDDNDRLADTDEAARGSNPLDRDSDDDGVLDNVDQAPMNASVQFDSDRDGIDNAQDNCSLVANSSQTNFDGDTQGDACDRDDDNDSVNDRDADGNVLDKFPFNAGESADADNDGAGNNTDTDDDNDGVADGSDAFPTNAAESQDTDHDGTGDNADTDRDGDGVANAEDDFPLDGTRSNATDVDSDGWPAGEDPDDNDAGNPGDAYVDSDLDGVGNTSDSDDDNDGIPDNADAFPLNGAEFADTDSDGTGNDADTDDDADGTADDSDRFPLNGAESLDTDNDGIGNNADTDDENDGVADSSEAGGCALLSDCDSDGVRDSRDNCPADVNSDQADMDGDRQGDVCDTDRDGDGTANGSDSCPVQKNAGNDRDTDGTDDACDTDVDGDGVANASDNCPLDSNSNQLNTDQGLYGDACDSDDDNDGVSDVDEASQGSSSTARDSDADGVEDGPDNCPAIVNPLQLNTDGDDFGDKCDSDIDGDGVDNGSDNCPANANANQTDANSNSVGDACEVDSDHDNIPDYEDTCPAIANPGNTDTDGDGDGNACDSDDDGDTLSDSQETVKGSNPLLVDTDGDTVPDPEDDFPTDASLSADADGDFVDDSSDNCPSLPNLNQANADDDDLGNACDSDDDNDGTEDSADVFPEDGSETADADHDGVGDNGDNCVAIANSGQQDTDSDGVGNVCESASALNGFYLMREDIVSASESTDAESIAGDCDRNEGDHYATLGYAKSKDSNVKLAFADEEFSSEGGMLAVDASGVLSMNENDSYQDESNGNLVARSNAFSGSVDRLGVITGTLTDTLTVTNGESSVVAECTYVSAITLTPMAKLAAEGLLAGDNGLAMLEAYENESGNQNGASFSVGFSYSVINTLGEQRFGYDAETQDWVTDAPKQRYLLSSGGWVSVDDAIDVQSTSTNTASLVVRNDEGAIVQTYSATLFGADVSGEAMKGFVPKSWAEYGLIDPQQALESTSIAVGMRAVTTQPTYAIDCDRDFGGDNAIDLTCRNYVVDAAPAQDGMLTNASLANSLADVLVSQTAVINNLLQGVPVAHAAYGGGYLYGFLRGSNITGAVGTSGTVEFRTVYMSSYGPPSMEPDALTDGQGNVVRGSWSISDPLHNGKPVLILTLPALVQEQYEMFSDEMDALILAVIPELGTNYVRMGGYTAAGHEFVLNGFNAGVITQLRNNFAYVPDSDRDGVADANDNCPAVFNPEQTDSDSNGIGDYCDQNGDTDYDQDGVIDMNDNCPGTSNPDQLDTDANGIGDACEGGGGGGGGDTDYDQDGVIDMNDNCPGTSNPDQLDSNSNGIGDACEGGGGGGGDTDYDQDGVIDMNDNCPGTSNPDQLDSNSNGIGDACEGGGGGGFLTQDADADGVVNGDDPFPFDPSRSVDTDGDGVADQDDAFVNDPARVADSDGDQIDDSTDTCPYVAGDCAGTPPAVAGAYLAVIDMNDDAQDFNLNSGQCEPDSKIAPTATFAFIEQEGRQVIVKLNEDTVFAGAANDAGDFSAALVNSIDAVMTLTGNLNSLGAIAITRSTGDGNVTCQGLGSLSLVAASEVEEQTQLQSAGGIGWFEADDNGGQLEIGYGLIADNADHTLLEQQFVFDPATHSFNTDAPGLEAALTTSGLLYYPDRFKVTGYVNAPHTAIIQPADAEGNALSVSQERVDMTRLDIGNRPLASLLPEELGGFIAADAVFSSGAQALGVTITTTADRYGVYCDDGWDEWFTDVGLNCRNVVAMGYVQDANDASDYDPVPAATLDDIVYTQAQLENGEAQGQWIAGDGASGSMSMDVSAYLVTDDGNANGANPRVVYQRRYSTYDGPLAYAIGEGDFVVGSVGAITTLEVTIPEVIARVAGVESPDEVLFFFADTDTINAESRAVVRRGYKQPAGRVEHEMLFNAIALDDLRNALIAGNGSAGGLYDEALINAPHWSGSALLNHGLYVETADFTEGQTTGPLQLQYLFTDSANGYATYRFGAVDMVDVPFTWQITQDNALEITITTQMGTEIKRYALADDSSQPGVMMAVESSGADLAFAMMGNASELNPGFAPAAFALGAYVVEGMGSFGFNLTVAPSQGAGEGQSLDDCQGALPENCTPGASLSWLQGQDGVLQLDMNLAQPGTETAALMWAGGQSGGEFLGLRFPTQQAAASSIGLPVSGYLYFYPAP